MVKRRIRLHYMLPKLELGKFTTCFFCLYNTHICTALWVRTLPSSSACSSCLPVHKSTHSLQIFILIEVLYLFYIQMSSGVHVAASNSKGNHHEQIMHVGSETMGMKVHDYTKGSLGLPNRTKEKEIYSGVGEGKAKMEQSDICWWK